MRRFLSRLLIGAILATQLSCGGNGDSSEAHVVALILDESVISVGSATVATVEFSFDSDEVFNHSEPVIIILRLPAGTAYRSGSGEIDIAGGNDTSAGGSVTPCNTGGSFVVFDLDKKDLLIATNPDGNADARLTLTIDGTARVIGTIEAQGSDAAVIDCSQDLNEDVSAAIEVR